jgi:hypothetical protein
MLAQSPIWKVDESTYQYTMTFVAKLNVDGKPLIGVNDKVAAFVGTTCRGISGLTYVASEASYYAYLTVFSNLQDEALYFKLYDSATDKITVVSKQAIFNVNMHKGNLFQSFSIAEPALNDKAEILTFNFLDIKSISSIISGRKAIITMYDSYDITALKPVFTLSKGGKLFKNRISQKSGELKDDFSTAITYEVLSEDESSISSYIVSVNQTGTPTLFYKKDAVCYAGGVIKVVSNQEGDTVVLTANSKTISTKKITNGEVLFSDLSSNSYILTIGNEWKLINILLKEK